MPRVSRYLHHLLCRVIVSLKGHTNKILIGRNLLPDGIINDITETQGEIYTSFFTHFRCLLSNGICQRDNNNSVHAAGNQILH